MAYYDTCQYCGARLDPGEKCDCLDEEAEDESTDEKTKKEIISCY